MVRILRIGKNNPHIVRRLAWLIHAPIAISLNRRTNSRLTGGCSGRGAHEPFALPVAGTYLRAEAPGVLEVACLFTAPRPGGPESGPRVHRFDHRIHEFVQLRRRGDRHGCAGTFGEASIQTRAVARLVQGEAAVRRENGNERERDHRHHPPDRVAEPKRPPKPRQGGGDLLRTSLAERLYAGLAASAIRKGFGDEKESLPRVQGVPPGNPRRVGIVTVAESGGGRSRFFMKDPG